MRLLHALRHWWHVRGLQIGDLVRTPKGIGRIVGDFPRELLRKPRGLVIDYGDRGRYLQRRTDCWRVKE